MEASVTLIPNWERCDMWLSGRNRLRQLYGIDAQTDVWLRCWESELKYANWKTSQDLLRQFPRARDLGADVFEFPVPYLPQAIQVAVTFPQAKAIVIGLECSK